ncbi:uncharacterized protein V1516DRAFT_682507 [Lipomyces oligophaga]|uniref:uncharacterized protein n=1 Tax=Lipomyces oligophaga TaxID=45792 RepID=UPI0034CF6D37
MTRVTVSAITSAVGTTTSAANVQEILAQPLKFRLAREPEEVRLTTPPTNFLVLSEKKKSNGTADAKSNDTAECSDEYKEPDNELFPRHSLPLEWTKRYPSVPGLINNGVTCYMNSVLQVLLHVPALVDYLLSGHKAIHASASQNCMMCTFRVLAEECYSSTSPSSKRRKPIHPRFILKKLRAGGARFSDHRQEDAHEFLRYFIEALQLSVAPKTLKEPIKETSVVHRIFGGRFRQQIKCRTCGYASNTFQAMLDIQLDIRRGACGTISDCLERFFAGEQLSKAKGNAYKCERCKVLVDASKRTLIYDPPEYCTLHLKRFDFTSRGISKISEFIKYPKILDLSLYSTRPESLVYELIGVIVHQGYRTSSGHYHSYCKTSDGTWKDFNDELVDTVSEKTALRQEAYILVYGRIRDSDRQKRSYESESSPEPDRQIKRHVKQTESDVVTQMKSSKLFGDDLGEVIARDGAFSPTQTQAVPSTSKSFSDASSLSTSNSSEDSDFESPSDTETESKTESEAESEIESDKDFLKKPASSMNGAADMDQAYKQFKMQQNAVAALEAKRAHERRSSVTNGSSANLSAQSQSTEFRKKKLKLQLKKLKMKKQASKSMALNMSPLNPQDYSNRSVSKKTKKHRR